DVWAAGAHSTGHDLVLVEHWDGMAWSRVITPSVPAVFEHQVAVDASSPDDVWVVGTSGNRGFGLHWDGSSWRLFRLPPTAHPTELYGVSALAPGDAWAVGTYEDNGYHGHVLTLHWNGSAWDVVPAVDGKRVKLLSAVDG